MWEDGAFFMAFKIIWRQKWLATHGFYSMALLNIRMPRLENTVESTEVL